MFCFNANKGGISKSNINFHLLPGKLKKSIEVLKKTKSSEIKIISRQEYKMFIEYRRKAKYHIKELFTYCKKLV